MSGKCLTKDTLIPTERGLLAIEELAPAGPTADGFVPHNLTVHGPKGKVTSEFFYYGGQKNTIRIRTRLGYEIEGTPEHPLWVRLEDGNETWKPLGEIETGAIVAILPGAEMWGSQTDICFEHPQKVRTLKTYPAPSTLTVDLAYMMGLLVGDGTLTYTNAINLSSGDAFIAQEFERIAIELFGYTVQRKSNRKDFRITSKEIRLFFEQLGLGYCSATEKSIPGSILKAPRQIVCAFLQGLFDTDGTADTKYGNVTLSTSSNRMARQVHQLLLNFGIISSLREKVTKNNPNYEVDISGENAIRFYQEIGFRLPRKQERGRLASKLRRPNVGGIPHLNSTLKMIQQRIVAKKDKPIALKKVKNINSIFYTYIPTGRNLSYRKLKELIEYCHANSVPCSEVEAIYERGYFYDRIVAVEKGGENEVFDLSVSNGHAFIANGFVSHNSTYLRQSALIALMAQMGSFVPADSARIGLVDRIFTRIGAQDEIHAGQSTFMVEMIEAANILNHATGRSLLILDEIGRGTSTYDGVSIAWAVVEYIHNHPHLRAKTLFATHYHELTQLADLLPGVRNYNVAVTEADNKVVFLHKIVPGGADRSYGIHVAQLAGLPKPVIQRANEIMAALERSAGKAVRINPQAARQVALFPETNPLLDELKQVDVNALSPIEALNKLFEWQKKFLGD
ncbi:MAG: MutS-related protein [Chloroflexota bacterium]